LNNKITIDIADVTPCKVEDVEVMQAFVQAGIHNTTLQMPIIFTCISGSSIFWIFYWPWEMILTSNGSNWACGPTGIGTSDLAPLHQPWLPV